MNYGTMRSSNIGSYMVVVVLLVGIIIGLCVSPLTAQRHDAFGEIVCTGITIVDENGAELVQLGADKLGGHVHVLGTNGVARVSMFIIDSGGYFGLLDNIGKAGVALHNNNRGGLVGVQNKEGVFQASLGISQYGGRVDVQNQKGKGSATIGIDEYGDGRVALWDKHGRRKE